MSAVVVLDPGIALGVRDEAGLTRLQEWASDARVRLGSRTWTGLAELYAAGIVGLPQSLSRIAHRSIGELLTRSPIEHLIEGAPAQLSARYLGLPAHRQILVDDLVGGELQPGTVLGTDGDFWEEGIESIGCIPPPPDQIVVHIFPNTPTPRERRDKRARWFSGRRLLIVGGQADEDVMLAISERLGVPSGDVNWVPSEKNKRARNLKSTIFGLSAGAIVICVVGKVGHDVSGEVKRYTQSRSLLLCESRFVSQVVGDLEELADRTPIPE